MKNVLVVAPHADDEVLGCGGTIYKYAKNGHNVFILIMTNAAVGAPELFKQEDVDLIRDEARRAHEILGVKDSIFLELPAPKLEQYPQYKIANEISKVINDKCIDTMYIPSKGDLHLDHGAVYNAALVASRPFPNQKVKSIYAYETLSETEWGHPTPDCVFIPQVFNPLDKEQFEKKLCAMKCFESQLKPFPNTRSLESIEHLAAHRGASIGNNFAESFMLVRSISEIE